MSTIIKAFHHNNMYVLVGYELNLMGDNDILMQRKNP